MTEYLLEWGGLLLRWLHIIAGISWVGASFYLVWLDNQTLAADGAERDRGVLGRVWAREAYVTWISGMCLLGLLYFQGRAAGIALGLLLASWLVYDGLCRTKLADSRVKLGIALAVLTCILAWGVSALFAGSGAFILFSSALGTIMAGNIFFVIAPGQRALLRAHQAGGEPDPVRISRMRQRFVHNTYLTLPVLFVMISIHSAMTYGGPYNWLVLVAMSFSGVCIRGWFLVRYQLESRRGFASWLLLIMGLLALIIIVIGLYPDAAA